MKILMVNKFLHPVGGSETYVIQLGAYLQELGHEVQYFGMEHPERVLGNRVGAYTANMDFHSGAKLHYALKTIYSPEAGRKLRLVLEDFQPEVCHLNNFHYQLTPGIILEIRKWSRQTGHPCRIVHTAHDYQLVCPNHMCRDPNTQANCEKCLGGQFFNCAKGRCIHGSFPKSLIGTLEAVIWNQTGVYQQIDTIICCSRFLKTKLDASPVLREKTVHLHNFAPPVLHRPGEKKAYVLYFGRYAQEKGIETLVKAARALPQIPFVFAGSGPLAALLEDIPNIRNAGFQTGAALEELIREARLTVCPSECYENCPFSVMESIQHGTPVLAAAIGGIPELIYPGKTGLLFESGNVEALKEGILRLWENPLCIENADFLSFDQYVQALLQIYSGKTVPGGVLC